MTGVDLGEDVLVYGLGPIGLGAAPGDGSALGGIGLAGAAGAGAAGQGADNAQCK